MQTRHRAPRSFCGVGTSINYRPVLGTHGQKANSDPSLHEYKNYSKRITGLHVKLKAIQISEEKVRKSL